MPPWAWASFPCISSSAKPFSLTGAGSTWPSAACADGWKSPTSNSRPAVPNSVAQFWFGFRISLFLESTIWAIVAPPGWRIVSMIDASLVPGRMVGC